MGNTTANAIAGPVTFIGAGVMGLPMVRNLLKGGMPVRVFDVRDDVRRSLQDEGIEVVATLKRLSTVKEPSLPCCRIHRTCVLWFLGRAVWWIIFPLVPSSST